MPSIFSEGQLRLMSLSTWQQAQRAFSDINGTHTLQTVHSVHFSLYCVISQWGKVPEAFMPKQILRAKVTTK